MTFWCGVVDFGREKMSDADRLPMANVSRIVASALPKDASVAKEARVALSACSTVFVHYITELAVQQCDKRKKVTLTPEDILEAVREAEFDDFEEPLKEALAQFRNQSVAARKPPAKKQKLDASLNESAIDEGAAAASREDEVQEDGGDGGDGDDGAEVHNGNAEDDEQPT